MARYLNQSVLSSLPRQMENCLVDQEFQFGDGDKQTVAQYLASQSKDLKIVAYQRFTLVAE